MVTAMKWLGLKVIMIRIRLLCGKKRAGVPRQYIIERAQGKELEVYHGFTEQPIRCICEIEDNDAKEKTVETIMPDGHVETQIKFKPKKGRALVTFGHLQHIPKELASKFVRRADGGCPFIHDENTADSKVYRLSQTWTMNLNERFYNTYAEIDESTVDACGTFRESMSKLFSSAKVPIRCYKMKQAQVNPELVFVGPRDLMEAFLFDADAQKYFSMAANQHGFKTWSIPKGRWFPRAKSFLWGSVMDDQVVLFTREGNSSMTVMVSKEQFLREKQFGEKL
jgi:hypothetical protein